MVDKTLFPHPPGVGLLVPAPAAKIEPIVRTFWHERFTGDPAFVDSFWSVVPGTKGYSATLNYLPLSVFDEEDQADLPEALRVPKGIPEFDLAQQTDLRHKLAQLCPDQLVYELHFTLYVPNPITAFNYRDWIYYHFDDLQKLEPGMPDDSWDFAESRGVIIERHPEPEPSPPVHDVCIVENTTHEELEPLRHELDAAFHRTARGTLITGDQSGDVGIEAAYKLKKTVYLIRSVPSADRFECLVFRDGDVIGEFQSRPRPSEDPQLDSVLGETTPHGILRALEVPPELVGLAPDPSA